MSSRARGFPRAVLLSLACSAIAGRILLTGLNTRYRATSKPFSASGLTGSCILDANVTTYQTFSFFFRVMGVPYTSEPTFDTPGYYDTMTDALVVEFPNCTFYREPTLDNWNCTVVDKPIKLPTPYQPVNTLRKLVDAGLFTYPGDFYVGVNVNGEPVVGAIGATMMKF
ncbi:unnamed protein product [Closterium sp. Naga37s-1]|nr:unnamed protein product [Closterium sp. Naga37s-1]